MYICCSLSLFDERIFMIFFASCTPSKLCNIFHEQKIFFMAHIFAFFYKFSSNFMNFLWEIPFVRICFSFSEIENISMATIVMIMNCNIKNSNKNHWKFAGNERTYLERIWTLCWTLKFLRLFTNGYGCIFSLIFHSIEYFIKIHSDLKWSPIKHLIYAINSCHSISYMIWWINI